MGTGHKSEHTQMVNRVLRDVAGQQGRPISEIFGKLFQTPGVANAGILKELFRETFQRLYPEESFNCVIWCPFCECFDLVRTDESAVYGESPWTFSSTQF
ncbi:hypothetical protein SB6414_04041 [Klebsiella pasteurii]|nr:hypothetical protein SB6414_04041 [Klebsiella pasteurii]